MLKSKEKITLWLQRLCESNLRCYRLAKLVTASASGNQTHNTQQQFVLR